MSRQMSRPSWTRRLIVAAVLAVGTAVAYAPAARLGFINYDDGDYVLDNPHVTAGLSAATVRWAFTTGHAANYHPLTWLSLAADAPAASVADLAAAMHRTNVALHAASVAVLFLLLAVPTGADAAAAVVAAVFAVHPAHVESVAWVAERKDVLCGLLFLSAVLAHVTVRPVGWRVAATTLLGAAALLSKPMAVSLPLVLLLTDAWPLRRRPAWLEQVPLLVLSAATCWVTVAVQSAAGAVQSLADVSLSARLQNVPAAYARYLGLVLWPTRLSIFYPYRPTLPPAAVAGGAAVLVVGTAAAVWAGRRRPFVAVGWLWFVVTLGPVIGVVQVGWQSLADRYLYLPLVGPTVVVVWAARRTRWAGGVLAVAVVAALAVATRQQLSYWRDTRTLFARSLALEPDNAVAHVQLGYLDKLDGDTAGAERHYAEAVRLVGRYGEAAFNLANLLRPKDPAAAVRYYRLALHSLPHDARVENNLGVTLGQDPARSAEAADHLRAAAADDPAYPDPHVNLGRLLLARGHPDAAAAEFGAALHLDPRSAAARRGLADCHTP